jgi:hypothetical protein
LEGVFDIFGIGLKADSLAQVLVEYTQLNIENTIKPEFSSRLLFKEFSSEFWTVDICFLAAPLHTEMQIALIISSPRRAWFYAQIG